MREIITFSYPHGKMSINLDKFFPCEKWRIRKLLKTMFLSRDRDHISEILMKIKEHLKEQAEEATDEKILKLYANECVNLKTKAKEMEAEIEKQAAIVDHLAALKQKPELKEAKAKLGDLKGTRRELLADSKLYGAKFTEQVNLGKKYRMNLDEVKTWMEERYW